MKEKPTRRNYTKAALVDQLAEAKREIGQLRKRIAALELEMFVHTIKNDELTYCLNCKWQGDNSQLFYEDIHDEFLCPKCFGGDVMSGHGWKSRSEKLKRIRRK